MQMTFQLASVVVIGRLDKPWTYDFANMESILGWNVAGYWVIPITKFDLAEAGCECTPRLNIKTPTKKYDHNDFM